MSRIFQLLLDAKAARRPCVLVTVTATKGSIPRHVGAKMIVYADGAISDTIGGGKFEALVIEAALQALADGRASTQHFPLHEHHDDSFGAICGGEVSVFIEPQGLLRRLIIVGAGHCSQALARAAQLLDWQVTVLDDREELCRPPYFHELTRFQHEPASELLTNVDWEASDCLVIMSRNFHIDREALGAVLRRRDESDIRPAYIGMIGSRKKVKQVQQELVEQGITESAFEAVHAPIGIKIGSDTPAEIAVSILAEILQATSLK